MNHTEYKDLPKIAVIGRPNVGKSSLFNRLLRHRKAITESQAGVTRDRLYAQICLGGVDLVLIDTGGITAKPKEGIAQMVYRQSREAITESDAVLFVCDITSGITYQDEHVASILRKSGKKSFLAVNKVDSSKLKNDAFDFYRLGLGKPSAISALHGKGISELSNNIVSYISGIRPDRAKKPETYMPKQKESAEVKIAIVGRPNVGKSSFINCILDQERMIVHETPGTTRDSIDVAIKRDKNSLVIVDTAGMRHKKRLRETVEVFSLARTKESIRRSDAVLIMTDITIDLLREDIAVIDYVIKQGKPCVLAVNKRDLVKDLNGDKYQRKLRERLQSLTWMPIVFTSCKQRRNIIKVIDALCAIVKKSKITISTSALNKLLVGLQNKSPHSASGKIRPKIQYATQVDVSPPTFLFFCTHPALIKSSYLRFIENSIRREFGFFGLPIFFTLKGKERKR